VNHGASSLVLGAVPWNCFGTLTYRKAPSRPETVVAHGLDYLEKTRQLFRLHVNEFFFFLRCEGGELNGRLHLHVLIRIPPRFRGYFLVNRGHVSWAHKNWSQGLTRFRPVRDVFDPAVDYITKQESCGADAYEMAKTGRAACGVPSPALLRRAALQKSAGTLPAANQTRKPH